MKLVDSLQISFMRAVACSEDEHVAGLPRTKAAFVLSGLSRGSAPLWSCSNFRSLRERPRDGDVKIPTRSMCGIARPSSPQASLHDSEASHQWEGRIVQHRIERVRIKEVGTNDFNSRVAALTTTTTAAAAEQRLVGNSPMLPRDGKSLR